MVLRMAKTHELLVTVDENAVAGGAGSAVNECLAANDAKVSVLNHGLPDRFIALLGEAAEAERRAAEEAELPAGVDTSTPSQTRFSTFSASRSRMYASICLWSSLLMLASWLSFNISSR